MRVTRQCGCTVVVVLVMAGMGPRYVMAASQLRAAGVDGQSLVDQGYAALTERRYADALAAFTEASKRSPAEPLLHYLIGYAAFQLGLPNEARPAFERALALDRRLTEASIGLALVLHQQGRVAEAVKAAEAGLEHRPDDKNLVALVAKWRAEAAFQSNLYEARGAHFSVLFQGPADDLTARRIVELLEEAYWRIGQRLATYPVETVPVVLYTQEQFYGAEGTPDWASAVYDGRIRLATRGALQRADELKSTLAHEFTHVVVAQLAGSAAPKWINEGLAEVLESDDVTRIERTLERFSHRIPFTRLERDFSGLSRDDVTLAYAQSAAAMKKMIDLRGMPAIVSLLRALGRGERFEEAFQQAISMRYADFIAMVARY